MEHKYFNIIKPIIFNCICKILVRCGEQISSEHLNELSNFYTDEIIENITRRMASYLCRL